VFWRFTTGYPMRLLSFFSPRSRPQAPADAPESLDGAGRAALLFGVPPPHLTREVRAAFNALMGEIESLRYDLDLARNQLADAEASADHDPLVSIYNRRAFMREAGKIADLVRRHEVEASLIYFDLNAFKEINDIHGHAAGDAVLRMIAETLVRQTRSSDLVGRIGGDEFAVLMTHVAPEAALEKAEALAAALRTERVPHDGLMLEISASYGLARMLPDDTAERALARADEAMYRDKALHRRARA
jgi:diguanylate cyclase (GGDEF)-like protein